jgi:methylated-DNA-protein-cysteine methyltransferase-like protein
MKGRNAQVYKVVRKIPRGRVATYGQIAALAGLGPLARQVGYALHALPPASTVPWHRVLNARGEISRRSVPGWELEQRSRLEREGVRFDARGRVSLQRFGWQAQDVRTRRQADDR